MAVPLSRKNLFFLCHCDFAHIPDRDRRTFQWVYVCFLFTVIENPSSTSVHVEGRGYIREFSTFVHQFLFTVSI